MYKSPTLPLRQAQRLGKLRRSSLIANRKMNTSLCSVQAVRRNGSSIVAFRLAHFLASLGMTSQLTFLIFADL